MGNTPGVTDVDPDADPAEQAAALRLRQAIQRIQTSRERRQLPATPGPGNSSNPDRRRDW
jgi:hypothetical protein